MRRESYLRDRGLVDDADLARFGTEAEHLAADVRTAMNRDMTVDPSGLFAHVYAEPTRRWPRSGNSCWPNWPATKTGA